MEPGPEPHPPIPAFLGEGGSFGAVGEAMYLDTVGAELGLQYVSAGGTGRFTFWREDGTYTVEQKISSKEVHVPILLKAQLPWWVAKPYASLGATFVVQTEANYVINNALVLSEVVQPPASNYAMFSFGAGAAIDIDKYRLPVELRINYQSLDSSPRARASYEYTETDNGGGIISRMSVNASWEAQFFILVGLQYRHKLELK